MFTGISVTKYISVIKREEYTENPLVLVIIALLLELSNIVLDTFHQISWIWWGEGVWFFDLFNNI